MRPNSSKSLIEKESVSPSKRSIVSALQRQQTEEYAFKLAAIVNSSDNAIISKTLEGIITSWNPAAEKLYGYKAKEAIGKSIKLIFPPDLYEEEFAILKRVSEGKGIKRFETVRVKKNGTLINILLTISPLINSKGIIFGASTIAQDITERKRIEQTLQESEKRYRQLFDRMSEGIALCEMIWDKKGIPIDFRYLEANRAWETHTGIPRKKIIGKRVKEVIPDIEQFWIDKYAQVVKTGKSILIENQVKALDKWFEVHAYRHSDNRFAALFVDITERKGHEQRKDNFIALASHELKTPVTSVKLYAGILRKRLNLIGSAKDEQFLIKMDRQLNRLTNLVRDLLDMSRIQNGKLDYNKEILSLENLITESVEDLQYIYSNRRFIIKSKTDVNVFADKDRLQQVVVNLITNAVRFSRDNSKLIINIRKMGSNVKVSVRDFGIGIPKGEQGKIFNRFYRIENDQVKTFPGLGMGLFIANEIIKHHDGKIWVDSTEGKGSTFSFTLPIHEI